MNEPINPQNAGSWTLYPSLLPSIKSTKHQESLEAAVRANYSGRFKDADTIFTFELPPLQSLPILALEYISSLLRSWRRGRGMRYLRNMIKYSSTSPETPGLVLLLELKLAIAEFYGLGKVPQKVQTLLARVRNHFSDKEIINLSDIEMDCIISYYNLVMSLRLYTNIVKNDDQSIFRKSEARTSEMLTIELEQITQAMKGQERWLWAAKLMTVILGHRYFMHTSPGEFDLERICSEAIGLCKAMSAMKHPAFKFHAVVLRLLLADVLAEDSRALALIEQCGPILQNIEGDGWESSFPSAESGISALQIRFSHRRIEEKMHQLEKMVDNAKERHDFQHAEQIYSWMEFALIDYTFLEKGSEAMEHLQNLKRTRVSFHQYCTKNLFNFCDRLSSLVSWLTNNSHYVTAVNTVLVYEPEFLETSIPRILVELYQKASEAANNLSMKERAEDFSKKSRKWAPMYPYSDEIGRISHEGMLDEFQATFYISSDDKISQYGRRAIEVLLHWAAHELEMGLLSHDHVRALFKPCLDDIAREDLARYLRDQVDIGSVSNALLGTQVSPRHFEEFLAMFQDLIKWAVMPNRPQSKIARLNVLRALRMNRIEIRSQNTQTIQERFRAAEENDIMLCLLQSQCGDDYTERLVAISATLRKCWYFKLYGEGIVTDGELISRRQDCQDLIRSYSSDDDIRMVYNLVLQALQLTWERYEIFSTQAPADNQTLVAVADRLFIELRQQIALQDPSDLAVALDKLSTDFQCWRHYEFALAGNFQALEALANCPNDEFPYDNAITYVTQFAYWTQVSKARAFEDIITMGTASNTNYSGRAIYSLDDLHLEEMEKASQALDILHFLPDNVVLIDYVIVRPLHQLIAVIYKKGRVTPFLLKLPIGHVLIDRWVANNLDSSSEQLDQEDSLDKLAELKAIAEVVVDPQTFVKEGDILMLCPTGSLHRVPIHAIPVCGEPLIKRNPVVYCQSLKIVYKYLKEQSNGNAKHSDPKVTVVNPMPDVKESGEPVPSTSRVIKLAHDLKALHLQGFNGSGIKPSDLMSAVRDSTIFHYHGHIEYNHSYALHSAMILNAKAYRNYPRLKTPGCEALFARKLFSASLRYPALSVLIGCGSGRGSVSRTDDVLGFPTALFFAGAASVIATLWPMEDEDGAAFSVKFYSELAKMKRLACENYGTEGEGVAGELNIAVAMQKAICHLMKTNNTVSPYHWAAFTLNGLWMLPSSILSNADGNVE